MVGLGLHPGSYKVWVMCSMGGFLWIWCLVIDLGSVSKTSSFRRLRLGVSIPLRSLVWSDVTLLYRGDVGRLVRAP